MKNYHHQSITSVRKTHTSHTQSPNRNCSSWYRWQMSLSLQNCRNIARRSMLSDIFSYLVGESEWSGGAEGRKLSCICGSRPPYPIVTVYLCCSVNTQSRKAFITWKIHLFIRTVSKQSWLHTTHKSLSQTKTLFSNWGWFISLQHNLSSVLWVRPLT